MIILTPNAYADYAPFGSGCSPALPFQNILCFPFYMNFKTAAKIIFFIQPTLRCVGGLHLHEQNFTYIFLYRLVRYDGTDSSDMLVPFAAL